MLAALSVPPLCWRMPTPASTERHGPTPEFAHGWKVVLACFCMALLSWGFCLYGQGVYLAELRRAHGWPSGAIAGASTFLFLASAVLMTQMHRAIAMLGARTVLIGGALLIATAAWAEAHVATLWQLYACAAVLAVGWSACSSVGIAVTVAQWFEHRRGLALSLAQNGASAAGFTVAPALVALTDAHGLRTAVPLILAMLLALILPLLLLALRHPIHPPVRRPGLQLAAIRSRGFWLIAGPFALAMTAQVGLLVHQVPFLLPRLGAEQTGLLIGAATIAALAGRLGLGAVIDRLNQRHAVAGCMASQAIGMILMLLWPQPVSLAAGMLLFGASVGNMITLPPLVVGASVPREAYAAIVALNGAVVQFCFAFGPALLGLVRDLSGGYEAVLALCAALQLAGAAVMWRESSQAWDRTPS